MTSGGSLPSLPATLPELSPDDFVRLEDRYKCPVCDGVLRNPCQTPCGHRICEVCVERVFAGGDEAACPGKEEECDVLTRETMYPDQSCRRELQRLMVKCFYRKAGCDAKVPWKALQTHYEQECPEAKVKCPNKCGAPEMKRRELERHKESCPKKPVQCKFRQMGCTFEGTAEEMAKHEAQDMSRHLDMVTVRTAQLELTNTRLESSLQTITRERDELATTLENQQRQNEQMKASLTNQEQAVRDLRLKLVGFLKRIIRVEQSVTGLPNPQQMEELRQTMEQMKQQLQTLQARGPAAVLGTGGTGGAGDVLTRYGDVATMADALTTQLSAHDRQIGIHDVRLAEMDLRFQILETASYDGTLLWKIRDYQRRKQDAVSGRNLSLYSQPFYTSRCGYKMCARVDLNCHGMGRTTYVSLFFVIMKGEYDAQLPWPFQRKVTLYLLDQGTDKRHLRVRFFPDASSTSFQQPTTERNIASGCFLFAPHLFLENPNSSYLKEDTIFFKVVVDQTNARGAGLGTERRAGSGDLGSMAENSAFGAISLNEEGN